MNKVIKHAIIGCGRIAQNHYNAAIVNGMEVVCCCDREIQKAKQFARKNGIKEYIEDYKRILNNDDVDSISICTDHVSHTDIAEDFAGKKNIVIEKPLSSSFEKANKFYKKMINTDKVITIISQHRFDDSVLLTKKVIENGDLGKITLVNAKLKCNRTTEYYSESYWRGKLSSEGGSTVINQSYHIIDTLAYLFGIPKEVQAYNENLKFEGIIDTEDTCVAILKYSNFISTFSSTNTSISDWETELEIIGTKGEVKFNLNFPDRIMEFNLNCGNEKYQNELNKIDENYNLNKNSGVNYYGLSHNRQFANFKEAILNNDIIKIGLKEALETQTILEMIYKKRKDKK